jgi:hypothetical protein
MKDVWELIEWTWTLTPFYKRDCIISSITYKHAVLLERGRNSQDQHIHQLAIALISQATLSLTIIPTENQDEHHWRRGQQWGGIILRPQAEHRIQTPHT